MRKPGVCSSSHYGDKCFFKTWLLFSTGGAWIPQPTPCRPVYDLPTPPFLTCSKSILPKPMVCPDKRDRLHSAFPASSQQQAKQYGHQVGLHLWPGSQAGVNTLGVLGPKHLSRLMCLTSTPRELLLLLPRKAEFWDMVWCTEKNNGWGEKRPSDLCVSTTKSHGSATSLNVSGLWFPHGMGGLE